MKKVKEKTVFLMVLFCGILVLSGCQTGKYNREMLQKPNVLEPITKLWLISRNRMEAVNDRISLECKKLPEGSAGKEANWILTYRKLIEESYQIDIFDWLDSGVLIYLDGDDIPELVIGSFPHTADIYTIKDGIVLAAAQLGSKYSMKYIPELGIVTTEFSSGAGTEYSIEYWRMKEQGELNRWLSYGYYKDYDNGISEDWFRYEDREISEKEYDSYYDTYIREKDFLEIIEQKKLYEYFFVLEE